MLLPWAFSLSNSTLLTSSSKFPWRRSLISSKSEVFVWTYCQVTPVAINIVVLLLRVAKGYPQFSRSSLGTPGRHYSLPRRRSQRLVTRSFPTWGRNAWRAHNSVCLGGYWHYDPPIQPPTQRRRCQACHSFLSTRNAWRGLHLSGSSSNKQLVIIDITKSIIRARVVRSILDKKRNVKEFLFLSHGPTWEEPFLHENSCIHISLNWRNELNEDMNIVYHRLPYFSVWLKRSKATVLVFNEERNLRIRDSHVIKLIAKRWLQGMDLVYFR